MAFPTLARMEARNWVGVCHLDVAFWEDVATVSDVLLGNVATVTLKPGKAWSRVYLEGDALFTEVWRLVGGDPVADATIRGEVAKDRLALMPSLWAMKGRRCVVVMENKNKDMLLLGDLRTPARSLVTTRTAGTPGDRNGYEVVFSLATRNPVPWYGGTPPDPDSPVDCETLEELLVGEDGADIWALLSPTQRAEVLAAAGVVEFDGISDEDPYGSILISDE